MLITALSFSLAALLPTLLSLSMSHCLLSLFCLDAEKGESQDVKFDCVGDADDIARSSPSLFSNGQDDVRRKVSLLDCHRLGGTSQSTHLHRSCLVRKWLVSL